ncbi:MAG TPA: phytanoyl-CoA dioxygenase family protein [Flavobacteriales bacterium]|nr:phytanoyl-CoA dioxygenase family protein [Flavobacteriales bacterium]
MEINTFSMHEFNHNGHATVTNVYSNEEINQLLEFIETADTSNSTFRKSADVFAIRQVLKEIPEIHELVFNKNLTTFINSNFGNDYFSVKSIYFDKPQSSNWFVAWHQDLTISVDKKQDMEGFGPWTVKQNQFAVQPPLSVLENIFTVRIHLDDTNENNGALNVIPASHKNGIQRTETISKSENTHCCVVPKGGIMLMKPLLFHSSGRTTNNQKRRVIHIEFSNTQLPDGLNWAEFVNVF